MWEKGIVVPMSRVCLAFLGLLTTLGIGAGACASSPTARPAHSWAASPPLSSRQATAASQIRGVVETNRLRIKSCYQRALLANQSLEGVIKVRLDILSSGAVSNVDVLGPERLRVMEACLKQTVSTFVFPSHREPYGTDFTYVFRRTD